MIMPNLKLEDVDLHYEMSGSGPALSPGRTLS
jgi:hypothetical protein